MHNNNLQPISKERQEEQKAARTRRLYESLTKRKGLEQGCRRMARFMALTEEQQAEIRDAFLGIHLEIEAADEAIERAEEARDKKREQLVNEAVGKFTKQFGWHIVKSLVDQYEVPIKLHDEVRSAVSAINVLDDIGDDGKTDNERNPALAEL
jgi:RNase H-fold protein (predicted Holliday junction resolvase)